MFEYSLLLHHAMRQPKTQSRAQILLGSEEWLEDVLHLAASDACAIIGDHDTNALAASVPPMSEGKDRRRSHRNVPARPHPRASVRARLQSVWSGARPNAVRVRARGDSVRAAYSYGSRNVR